MKYWNPLLYLAVATHHSYRNSSIVTLSILYPTEEVVNVKLKTLYSKTETLDMCSRHNNPTPKPSPVSLLQSRSPNPQHSVYTTMAMTWCFDFCHENWSALVNADSKSQRDLIRGEAVTTIVTIVAFPSIAATGSSVVARDRRRACGVLRILIVIIFYWTFLPSIL